MKRSSAPLAALWVLASISCAGESETRTEASASDRESADVARVLPEACAPMGVFAQILAPAEKEALLAEAGKHFNFNSEIPREIVWTGPSYCLDLDRSPSECPNTTTPISVTESLGTYRFDNGVEEPSIRLTLKHDGWEGYKTAPASGCLYRRATLLVIYRDPTPRSPLPPSVRVTVNKDNKPITTPASISAPFNVVVYVTPDNDTVSIENVELKSSPTSGDWLRMTKPGGVRVPGTNYYSYNFYVDAATAANAPAGPLTITAVAKVRDFDVTGNGSLRDLTIVNDGTHENCYDKTDNDGDGQVDCDDSDCTDYCTPAPTKEICNDYVDNDGDGMIDCKDSDCNGTYYCPAPVPPEICNDGKDNDGDGTTDCQDSDCASHCQNPVNSEICNDNKDNDSDGKIDCQDSDCASYCQPVVEICDDQIDNDSDGKSDCEDPDCANHSSCGCDNESFVYEDYLGAAWTSGPNQYLKENKSAQKMAIQRRGKCNDTRWWILNAPGDAAAVVPGGDSNKAQTLFRLSDKQHFVWWNAMANKGTELLKHLESGMLYIDLYSLSKTSNCLTSTLNRLSSSAAVKLRTCQDDGICKNAFAPSITYTPSGSPDASSMQRNFSMSNGLTLVVRCYNATCLNSSDLNTVKQHAKLFMYSSADMLMVPGGQPDVPPKGRMYYVVHGYNQSCYVNGTKLDFGNSVFESRITDPATRQ